MTAEQAPPAQPTRAKRRGAPTKAKSASAFGVTFEGTTYVVDSADVSFADAYRIQRAAGMSSAEFGEAVSAGMDLRLIAGLVWIAARADNRPDLSFDDVFENLKFGDILGDEAAADVHPLPLSDDAS